MTPIVSLPTFALENCIVSTPHTAAMPLFSTKFGYEIHISNGEAEPIRFALESAAEQQAWVKLLENFKVGGNLEAADSLKVRSSHLKR